MRLNVDSGVAKTKLMVLTVVERKFNYLCLGAIFLASLCVRFEAFEDEQREANFYN
jgi:hypothetical protein